MIVRASKSVATMHWSNGLRAYLRTVAATGRLDGVDSPDLGVEVTAELEAVVELEERVDTVPVQTEPVAAFGLQAWNTVYQLPLEGLILRVIEGLDDPRRDALEAIRYLLHRAGTIPRTCLVIVTVHNVTHRTVAQTRSGSPSLPNGTRTIPAIPAAGPQA